MYSLFVCAKDGRLDWYDCSMVKNVVLGLLCSIFGNFEANFQVLVIN